MYNYENPLETLYAVIHAIEREMAISPKGSILSLSFQKMLRTKPISETDLGKLLCKLQQDEKVISIQTYFGQSYQTQQGARTTVYTNSKECRFLVIEGFEAYASKIKKQYSEYRAQFPFGQYTTPSLAQGPSIGVAKPSIFQPTLLQSSNMSKAGLSIQYNDLTREITLNGEILIATPTYDSENYRFFQYVWDNPNRQIPFTDFNPSLDKSISKVLDNLNFRGQLREAFFQTTKTSVCFTPTRSIEDLKAAGLYPLRVFSAQKAG